MLDRILHQRLQDHAGHKKVERGRLEFLDHLQLVTPKARHFDIEIIIEELQLLAQWDERVSLAQQTPQNVAQLHDHLAGGIGIAAHQRSDRIQRVEEEVGIDLALQRFHAGLQQQALLLLQLHLDAYVVQHLERDGDRHDGARVDRQVDRPGIRIERKNALGKGTMQLYTDELQTQYEEEERGLPIDEGLADAASNPVINAEVEKRRKRPDRLAIGAEMTQHASQKSCQDVHRQRKPLAQKQRRQRNQDASRGASQTAADYAHQDGALESDVSSLEVVYPTTHQHAQRDRDRKSTRLNSSHL